jgi:hypothetical protein
MIDELERIRNFRADEPGAGDEAWQAARGALLEAMASESAPTHPRRGRRRGRRPSPSRRRSWLARSALAATAALAAAVIVDLATSGSATAPSPAVAAAFERLATIAASGPSTVPGPGQYLYVDSETDYSSTAVARQSCVTYAIDHRQVWIGADGSGLLRETTAQSSFTSAADRAICLSMKPSPLTPPGTSNLWFAARCFSLGPGGGNLQTLSTDPHLLLEQMRRIDGGPRTPGEDFVHVGDFLRETDASPALRAALYRAAALIPGVQLLGLVRDHAGRLGLGVGYGSGASQSILIFNPRTAAFMGEGQRTSSGAWTDWAVYLQSRVVNQPPPRAPAPLTPPCVNGGGYSHDFPSGSVMTGAPPN